jgi:hypothetical protein
MVLQRNVDGPAHMAKVLTLVWCQYYCAINIDRLGSRGHTIILHNKSIVQYY